MNNEEKILQVLEQMNGRIEGLENGQASMQEQQVSMMEQQEIHTRSITKLENSVMHELKLLNELLPNALAKREAFEDVAAKVEDHDRRIFALEQKAANE